MQAVYATRTETEASSGSVVPRKLFVWGTGEAGQLSLGGPDDDNINKLTKPKPFGNKTYPCKRMPANWARAVQR